MAMINTLQIIYETRFFRTVSLLVFCSIFLVFHEVKSETLEEALSKAYQNNPDLTAARINLRKVNEGVASAKAGWRPTVSSSVSLGTTYSDTNPDRVSTDGTSVPGRLSVSVTQPLYTGGSTKASVRKAESNVQAERSRLFLAEQKLLLDGATAYVDVITARSVVQLQTNNLARIEKQLEATRERFRVGEVTRTDVAQSEARADRAKADRIKATGDLESSGAIYERVFGEQPGDLSSPVEPNKLPLNIDDAVKIALQTNFRLVAAKFSEMSALDDVVISKAGLLPTINLSSSASVSKSSGDLDTDSTSLSLTANVRVPLYSAGATYSSIRSAKEEANRQRILVEASRRSVIDSSSRAFISWKTAKSQAQALLAEVSSAEVALEGVEQEALVGARTVLDVLDAEQERLGAQVSLVRANRDAFVASYTLLSALGKLTAESISLPVSLYNFDRHFMSVKDRYYGDQLLRERP
jgi:outer membrane protein